MNLTQIELSLIAEALQARIETGSFNEARSKKGCIVFCSPAHLKALIELADKIVNMQEYEENEVES